MSKQVRIENDIGWDVRSIKFVAGLDTSDNSDGHIVAVLAVLTFPDLQPVIQLHSVLPEPTAYIPGLLGFREAPHFIRLIEELFATHGELCRDNTVFLVDGNGVLHERQFGSACHVGVLADVRYVGVAKKYYACTGVPEMPPEGLNSRGDWVQLGSLAAAAVKTSAHKPMFVSVGHRLSLSTCLDIVMMCCPRFRVPEPIRAADQISRVLAKQVG